MAATQNASAASGLVSEVNVVFWQYLFVNRRDTRRSVVVLYVSH